jgi:hypothetical protein
MRGVPAGADAPPLIAPKSQRIGITMALVTLNSSQPKIRFQLRGFM